jgi:hypothetical protein
LIEEAKKQGKPYGLYFEDISSGFAVTSAVRRRHFQVIPLVVWRVYVDGRPDELVRGVSIVGTPLAAMKRILATGDKSEVFNGECGAESGTVPVSAVAPAMLLSEMETQRQPQGTAGRRFCPFPARKIRDQRSSIDPANEGGAMNPIRPIAMLAGAGFLAAFLAALPARSRAAHPRRCRKRPRAEGHARRAGPQHEPVAVEGLREAVLHPVPH